jgi:uncharacterized protein YjbJ (UPF0337 family)
LTFLAISRRDGSYDGLALGVVHTAGLPPTIGGEMSFLDKLLGRSKQAAGDLKDDPEMRQEGMHQEAEGAAKDRAEQAEDMAQEARDDAAAHRAEREDPM